MPIQRISAAEALVKRSGESIFLKFDCAPWLASDVTLDTVSSVTFDPTGPVASLLSVNMATFTNGKGGTVPIGKGVIFRCTGGVDDMDYDVTCTVTNTAGETLQPVGRLMVRDE